MKSIALSILILLTGLFVKAQDGSLIWSDEFNGTGAPFTGNWSYDLGSSGWGNNELQNYTNSLTNSRQENGLLIIEAVKKGKEWTSARLVTKDKFEFTYGRLVFRAKLPAGRGTWPALWMLGGNNDEVGWPACGEIDVMEHIGRRPGIVQCAMHTPASHGNTQYVGYITVNDFDSEFHLYEANWTKQKIEFSVDGKIFYTYEPVKKDKDNWPFDSDFFIIMNIAIGGGLGSDPLLETDGLRNGIDPALESVKMEVDYVRVYKNADSIIKK